MGTLKWEFGVQARAKSTRFIEGITVNQASEHKKKQTSDNDCFKDHENILRLETHKTKHKDENFFLTF